ncbi:solute carrier family 22 member 3-like [Lampetra fluviatilis]
MADFDSVLQGVGEFGPFQHRVFAMLCLPCTLFAFQYLNIVFLGQVPEHRCRVPTETRRTSSRCGASLEAAHRNRSRASGSVEDQWNLQCMRVNTTTWSDSNAPCGLSPWGQGDEVTNASFSGRLIACDHGWEFDTEETGLTLVSEFDLVCENAWLLDLSQALLNVGLLVGAILMGYVSDRYGRRWSLMVSIVMQTIFGVLVAFAPNYAAFVCMRTLQGIFNMGSWTTVFVIATEFGGSGQRRVVHMVLQMFFSFGVIILSGIAYCLRTWRYLQLALTLPNVVLFSYYWLLPESPRWLISQNRKEQAFGVLKKISNVNGRELSDNIRKNFEEVTKADEKAGSPSIADLMRSPKIRKYTVVLMIYWFVVGVVYQGLAMSTGNIGDNVYLAFLMGGLAEIPGALMVIALIDRVGRRLPMCVAPGLSGLACLATALVPHDIEWLNITLVTLGRLGLTMAYEMVTLVNNELYPTHLRNMAMSTCSSLSGIGGIVAPFVLYRLYTIWRHLPMVIFGILAIIGGSVILLLPETNGLPLPETTEDAENISKKQKMLRSRKLNTKNPLRNGDSQADGNVTATELEFINVTQ